MSFIAQFFLLVLLLIFVELYLLIRTAEIISMGPTLLLCVLTGVLGGALVRSQGLRTLREIQGSLARGRLPTRDIVSGLILLVIGTMLLTPGFITDSLGFLLLAPPVRRWAAGRLIAHFKNRLFPRDRGGTTRGPRAPEDIIIEVKAEEIKDSRSDS